MYSAVPFADIKCFQLFELIFIILFGSRESGEKRLLAVALFCISPEVVVVGEDAAYVCDVFDYFVFGTLDEDLVKLATLSIDVQLQAVAGKAQRCHRAVSLEHRYNLQVSNIIDCDQAFVVCVVEEAGVHEHW